MSDEPQSYDGPAHSAPYPLSRLSAPVDLVRIAEEIAAANALLKSVAGAKLEAIAEQIRALQTQAAQVLEQTRRDAELHRARCSFRKRPGAIYHLYRKPDGSGYLSLLSPADWGEAPPHAHAGSYRLEVDMSWTPLQAVEERDLRRAEVSVLLGAGAGRG